MKNWLHSNNPTLNSTGAVIIILMHCHITGMHAHMKHKIQGVRIALFSCLALSFISGSVAGTAAMTVSFPFDVLRTRMIGQGNFHKVCWLTCSIISNYCFNL